MVVALYFIVFLPNSDFGRGISRVCALLSDSLAVFFVTMPFIHLGVLSSCIALCTSASSFRLYNVSSVLYPAVFSALCAFVSHVWLYTTGAALACSFSKESKCVFRRSATEFARTELMGKLLCYRIPA